MDGYTRRVVLHRPGPEAVWPLAAVSSPHVVVEEERTVTPSGTFAVSPFVAGRDLDALAGEGLPARAVADLLGQAVAGLQAARAAGVGHGALSSATIRIDPSGTVRLLGFRGGGESDLADLWELGRAYAQAAPPLDELLANPPATLDDAEAALRGLPRLPGPTLREIAADAPVVLHPHALSGVELREAPPAPPMPAKVRIAGTAAATLLLGLLAGVFLAAGPAEAPGEALTVPCGGGEVVVEGQRLQVRTIGCE